MSDLGFDFSAIDKLAADLGEAPKDIGKNTVKAVQVAAGNVKQGWRDRIKGSSHVSRGASSISYDLHGNAGDQSEISAEIGPTLSSAQGAIVGLVEMGAPKKNLAPHGYGLAALKDEQDDFEGGLQKAVNDSLKQADL
jgi:hypothetical protein